VCMCVCLCASVCTYMICVCGHIYMYVCTNIIYVCVYIYNVSVCVYISVCTHFYIEFHPQSISLYIQLRSLLQTFHTYIIKFIQADFTHIVYTHTHIYIYNLFIYTCIMVLFQYSRNHSPERGASLPERPERFRAPARSGDNLFSLRQNKLDRLAESNLFSLPSKFKDLAENSFQW
jgi:hypothetical protein